MSAELNALTHLLLATTTVFRKGPEVTERHVGNVHVVEVFGYPATSSHGALVDVHFVNVGFTEAIAGLTPATFLEMVTAAEHGNYADVPLARLAQGPSYIELGLWLGDQEIAFRFLAVGAHLGLWTVVTPATFGVTDPEVASSMAGLGLVMNSGLKTPAPERAT